MSVLEVDLPTFYNMRKRKEKKKNLSRGEISTIRAWLFSSITNRYVYSHLKRSNERVNHRITEYVMDSWHVRIISLSWLNVNLIFSYMFFFYQQALKINHDLYIESFVYKVLNRTYITSRKNFFFFAIHQACARELASVWEQCKSCYTLEIELYTVATHSSCLRTNVYL